MTSPLIIFSKSMIGIAERVHAKTLEKAQFQTAPDWSEKIRFEELAQLFDIPFKDVCKQCAISPSLLKKICDKNGIPKWPYRKLRKLYSTREKLQNKLRVSISDSARDKARYDIEVINATVSNIKMQPIFDNKNKPYVAKTFKSWSPTRSPCKMPSPNSYLNSNVSATHADEIQESFKMSINFLVSDALPIGEDILSKNNLSNSQKCIVPQLRDANVVTIDVIKQNNDERQLSYGRKVIDDNHIEIKEITGIMEPNLSLISDYQFGIVEKWMIPSIVKSRNLRA